MWDELEVISEGIKVIKRNLLDFVKKVYEIKKVNQNGSLFV